MRKKVDTRPFFPKLHGQGYKVPSTMEAGEVPLTGRREWPLPSTGSRKEGNLHNSSGIEVHVT